MLRLQQHLTNVTLSQVEHSLDLAHGSFACVERLANLHLNTARSLLEHGLTHTRGLMQARNPLEMLQAHAQASHPAVNNTLVYLQSAQQIATLSQREHSERLQQHFSRSQAHFSDTVAHVFRAMGGAGQ